jgi:hypothetical protein
MNFSRILVNSTLASLLNNSRRLNKSSSLAAGSRSGDYRPWDFGEISLLVLFIFGTIGNLLSIVVVNQKRMRHTGNASLFVTCIAISDMFLLFFKFCANMIKLYRIPIYRACVVIHSLFPQTAMFISIWLIMITTGERTLAVLCPLKVGILFSRKRCKLIILLMSLVCLLLSSTIGFCLEYNEEKPYYCQIKGRTNGTCFQYYTYVFPWIKSSFGSWIPSILCFVLNIMIIRGLYAASRERNNILGDRSGSSRRKESSSGDKHARSSLISKRNSSLRNSRKEPNKEKQITIMLITISMSFFILTFPYSAFDLLRKVNVNWKFLKNRQLLRIVMLLVDINHATNFILYCLTGKKFRDELKSVLLCRSSADVKALNKRTSSQLTGRHSSTTNASTYAR